MKRIISLAMMVMTIMSCVNKNDLGSNGPMCFTATFNEEEPALRACPSHMADDVKVLWEAGDRVGVYAADGAPVQFTAASAGETTQLNGEPISGDGVFYAMYPYDPSAVITGKHIVTSIPAEQRASKDSFAAHLAVSSTIDEEMNFNFRNVCAIMKVYVGSAGLTRIVFKGNNQEIVAGDIIVNATNASYKNGSQGSQTVTFYPPSGESTFQIGTYYFSVLPQHFQRGFLVTAYKGNDVFDRRIVNEPTHLLRSQYVPASAFVEEGAIVPGENGIRIPEQLISFAKSVNLGLDISSYCNSDDHVVLLDDINLPDMDWTPIGNATGMAYNNDAVDMRSAFSGVFDGQGHTIRGLHLTPSGTEVTTSGLFGATKDAIIKNVNFDEVKMEINCLNGVSSGHLAIGTVVGYAVDTFVEDVKVNAQFTGSTLSTSDLNISIAGIVGIMAATGIDKSYIKRCSFDGMINTDIGSKYTNNNSASVGGILGSVLYKETSVITIENCINDAMINVKSHRAAGIAAAAAYVKIRNCINNGDITANYSSNWTPGFFSDKRPVLGVRVGGIIGYNQVSVSNVSCLEGCINRGTISTSQAASAAGGVAGLIRTTSLNGCKNSGNVYASSAAVDYTITNQDVTTSGTLPAGRGLLVGLIQTGDPVTFSDCWVCGCLGTDSESIDIEEATQDNYLNLGALFNGGSNQNWNATNIKFWANPE